MCMITLVTGCAASDMKNAQTMMLNKLTEKYGETFEIVDMDVRPTSDVNELGDVYYAYVKYTGAREEWQNKGFYCEVNRNLTIFDDSFATIKCRPSLDNYYDGKVTLEDARVVTAITAEDSLEYTKRFNHTTIFNNGIEHSVTIVIGVSDVDAKSMDAEMCYKELEESLANIQTKLDGSLYIVYCDEGYVDEYIDYLNHLQKFNYKVKYKKIVCDVTLDLSSITDVKSSFIRQINSDLNAED